ncbi:DUF2577 family protein [Rummeliibacillus sp. JY-2-4R]
MTKKKADQFSRGSSPGALIVHTIRSISEKSQRTYIDFGTVQKAPPNLEIVCEDDGLVLEVDDLVVAQHLMAHERDVYIDGEKRLIHYDDVLKVGDRVLIVYDDETDDYCVIDVAKSYEE